MRGIIRYTRKQWSDAQVRRYINKLEQGLTRLASAQPPFRDMGALYPALRIALRTPLRLLPAARHRARTIVGIFHERMDLMTRLSEKLDVTNT